MLSILQHLPVDILEVFMHEINRFCLKCTLDACEKTHIERAR